MLYVCSEENGKFGIKDTSDNTIEFYSSDELYKITRDLNIEIDGVVYHTISVRNELYVGRNKEDLLSKYYKMLMKEGVEPPLEKRLSTRNDSAELECRFLGGMSNWHSVDDEDRCDADRLDRSVLKLIHEVSKEFLKETGYHGEFTNHGEKGWGSLIVY